MTPKEIAESILNLEEYDDYLRDVELTYKVPELAQAYLQLESRLQKLEKVTEVLATALRRIHSICDSTWGELEASVWIIEEDNYEAWHCRDIAQEALAELDQP